VNLLEVDLKAGLKKEEIRGGKKDECTFKDSVSNNMNVTSASLKLSRNHYELLNIL
jgi:hypothetical protein